MFDVMVRVSVITVVFNDYVGIRKTIDNVLKQTYDNLEYIIVDGASTDGTAEIIKEYDDRVSKWVSEPDKGIYDAMNKGVLMATGEWIIFRNSGDFFIRPDSIETVFSQYEDGGEDFIVCNLRYFKNYGYKDVKPSILTKGYFEAMPVNHPATFIRASTQNKYMFRLQYKNSADYCFFVDAFAHGATYKYIDITVGLFDNNAGATTDHYDRSILDNISIMKQFHAPESIIRRLRRGYRVAKLKNVIRRFIPCYCFFNEINLKRQGWVKEDMSVVLKDI